MTNDDNLLMKDLYVIPINTIILVILISKLVQLYTTHINYQ